MPVRGNIRVQIRRPVPVLSRQQRRLIKNGALELSAAHNFKSSLKIGDCIRLSVCLYIFHIWGPPYQRIARRSDQCIWPICHIYIYHIRSDVILLLIRLSVYTIMTGCAHSGKSLVIVPLPYYINFLILILYLCRTNTFNYIILFIFLPIIYICFKRSPAVRAVLSRVTDVPR